MNIEKNNLADLMNNVARDRDKWIKKNEYYYKDLIKFFRYNIPEGSSVLEVGCGTGEILASVKPLYGVGIDISAAMIDIAAKKYPRLKFIQMDAEQIMFEDKFEYIIISDTLGYFFDIQKVFSALHKVADSSTRIVITYHSFLWTPFLRIAELLRLKMPQKKLNWLNQNDIIGLLECEGFEIVTYGKRLLFPKYFPLISTILNKFIAHFPLINRLCLTGYIISRMKFDPSDYKKLNSISIIVPARNEKGNIEIIAKKLIGLKEPLEVIFVEGNSTDGTLEEIKRVCEKYKGSIDIKYFVQGGKGKGNAVRCGFSKAKGDILIILDSDMSVPPEELPKFFNIMRKGVGEFVYGSRLVYPLEKDSMRILNLLANKFFSIVFSWLLGQRIKDTLCGTKVITKQNYEKLIKNRKYFGNFDPFGDFDLILGSSKLNLKFIEIPIRYYSRQYGQTNISRFLHGWLLLKMSFFALFKIKFY
ncbi:MAG: glycosyltransferase [Ignavibacteriales bacterium]|nr:glycosyltransferase [Ignavibacteriales bacterium]